MTKKSRGAHETPAQTHTISDLGQIKALSHPLRVRILETLAESDGMTTKQVADVLEEKPTRLYHHVDLLEKSGLIRLTHTKPNRGTTEKYYQAIARQFQADSSLFTDENAGDAKGALAPMIRTVMQTTTGELLRLVEAHGLTDSMDEEGLLTFVEMHLTQEQTNEVTRRLKDVVNYLQSLAEEPEREEELRKFRLTLAYYPLDRMTR